MLPDVVEKTLAGVSKDALTPAMGVYGENWDMCGGCWWVAGGFFFFLPLLKLLGSSLATFFCNGAS